MNMSAAKQKTPIPSESLVDVEGSQLPRIF